VGLCALIVIVERDPLRRGSGKAAEQRKGHCQAGWGGREIQGRSFLLSCVVAFEPRQSNHNSSRFATLKETAGRRDGSECCGAERLGRSVPRAVAAPTAWASFARLSGLGARDLGGWLAPIRTTPSAVQGKGEIHRHRRPVRAMHRRAWRRRCRRTGATSSIRCSPARL
jgi:hypothetical protein